MAVARVDEIEDGSSIFMDENEEYLIKNISFKDIETYFQVHLMYIITPKSMWLPITYLHYTLKLTPWNVNKSDTLFNEPLLDQHAESKLLNVLKEKLDELKNTNNASDDIDNLLSEMNKLSLNVPDTQTRSRKDATMMKMHLQIVMNYSPCIGCANKILEFKKAIQEKCDSDISIIFGSFYLIYPKTDENGHIEGLAKLHKAGIKLRLAWEVEFLKETLKKIGTKKNRVKREKKDEEYLKLVIEKAKTIPD